MPEECRWFETGEPCGKKAVYRVEVTDPQATTPRTPIFVCEKHLEQSRKVNYMAVSEVKELD